jgi:hypothetical protein
LLGDESGVIQAVLWNGLCPMYYYHTEVGDILLVSGFKIRSHSVEVTHDFAFELSLNPSHPEGVIIKAPRENISHNYEDILSLYDLLEESLNETQRRHLEISREVLSGIPPYYYDIEGLVIYAGPICRESNQPKTLLTPADTRNFYEYRWIKISIENGQETPIKLYTCSSLSKLHRQRPLPSVINPFLILSIFYL